MTTTAENIGRLSRISRARQGRIAEQLQTLKKKRETLQAVDGALDHLARGWRGWARPGKYGQTWFMIKALRVGNPPTEGQSPIIELCDPFFPTQLVDELARAQQGVKLHHDDSKTIPVPLADINAALERICPNCGRLGPVLGCYEQTVDSPDGDMWVLSLDILCRFELCLVAFAQQKHPHDFLAGLLPPTNDEPPRLPDPAKRTYGFLTTQRKQR